MNNYSIISKLGQGAFAVVYKVKRKEDSKEYAMKKIRIMSLSEKELSNCLNEVRILASIENPFVLAYKDSFFDELTNTFCIITEYLEGGDISAVITKHKAQRRPIPESFIWKTAMQTLQALEALHGMNILHRDIKSANIFLDAHKDCKLGDMNVSIVSSNGMARTQTGTPYYASPEVWNQKPYNSKCDIWSLGCVLYEMATFKPPFISSDLRSLKKVISTGTYKKIQNYSPELEAFIKNCLRVNPKQRSSVSQLLNNQRLQEKCGSYEVKLEGCKSQRRMLEKIVAPRKREFRIIKEKLPRNKFDRTCSSQDKVSQNRSAVIEKDKENIEGRNRILIRTQTCSTSALKKSTSIEARIQNIRNQRHYVGERPSIDGKPPLPKPKQLRA